MSTKTEERLAYFVITLMILASFGGLIAPLMNPSYYSKLLPGIYAIPMVQHNIDHCSPSLDLSRSASIDVNHPITIFCEKETMV